MKKTTSKKPTMKAVSQQLLYLTHERNKQQTMIEEIYHLVDNYIEMNKDAKKFKEYLKTKHIKGSQHERTSNDTTRKQSGGIEVVKK